MNASIKLTSLRLPLLFPFLAPAFICFRSWIILLIQRTSFNPVKHGFLMIMFMFIGEILIGIFELISVLRQRHKIRIKTERKTIMHFPYYQGEDKKERDYSLLFLFLMALLDFGITTGLLIISSQLSKTQLNLEHELKIIQILFTALLSYFLLNVSMYRHQFLSFGLILCGVIMILSQSIENLFLSPYYLVFFAFTSTQEVIEKWLMYSKYISPFKLLFIEGLFGLGISSISLCIVNYIPCSWEFCKGINLSNTIESFNEAFVQLFEDKMNIVSVAAYIISTTGLNICTTLTSKYFTATHRTISDTLSSFIWGIIDLIWISDSELYLPLIIPSYVIIFLGCLLYNEIIIITCCGMDEYTNEGISLRSIVDRNNTLSDNIINRIPEVDSE